MFSQLRGIWISYATRRVNWLLFLAGFCLMLGTLMRGAKPTFFRVTPQVSTLWMKSGSVDEGYRRYTTNTGQPAAMMTNEWDWSEWNAELDSLSFSPNVDPNYPDPWDRIASMPNLRHLRMGHFRSPGPKICEGLKPVSRLTQLEFLELPGIPFTGESVAPWKSLTKLEWLDANAKGCTFTDGLESLPLLASLHTLDIDIGTLTPEAADYLLKLPNLRTLILRNQTGQHHPRMAFPGAATYMNPTVSASREAIVALAKSTSLEYVYVPGREMGPLEDFVKRSLPNVEVRPLYVSNKQSSALVTATLGAMFWVLIPALAVLGQFTRPESLLTPNYKKPHLMHARLFMMAAIAVGVACAALRMVAWPVALATILGLTGFAVCWVRPKPSKWLQLGAIIWPIYLLLWQPSAQIWLRGYLFGEHGWPVAFAFAIAGLGMLTVWARSVKDFHRQNSERGVHHPVFTVEGWGRADKAALASQAPSLKRDQTPLLIRHFVYPPETELNKATHNFSRLNPIARRRLFAVPSYGPTAWIVCLFALANLVVLGQRYFYTGTTALNAGVSAIVIFTAGYAIVSCVTVVIRRWFTRRTSFASELCRPCSRREFVDDIFLISQSNVARPVLAVCAVQAALAFVSYSSWLQAATVGTGLGVFLIGFATICYAAGMFSITLENDWMLLLVFGATVCGVLAIIAAVISLSSHFGSKLMLAHPFALGLVGLALFLIGCGLLAYARSCWSRLEFASLVR